MNRQLYVTMRTHCKELLKSLGRVWMRVLEASASWRIGLCQALSPLYPGQSEQQPPPTYSFPCPHPHPSPALPRR